MKFAEPIWLLAGLIACGALVWAWRRYDARQRAALATFASSHLHAQLTASFSTVRRNWKRGLFLAAVGCLFVALARPQAGFRWEEMKRHGIEVIFAVDTSRSMLTPDMKPDRLTRAKLAVDDFVSKMNGDGVGLIAFAGNAFLQCPITLDYDAFHESLAALDTTIIPRGGTDIASAIHEAQAALQNRPATDNVLVLLTDGEDLEGSALDTAKAAATDGLKICTVGVGTATGDLIPIPPEQGGGFVKDESGQFVKSHLDQAGLQAIAAVTGGIYAPLGAQGQGLDTIYQQALAPLAKHELASRRQRVYTERFHWPLAASLVLLLASTLVGTRRRSARKLEAPAAATGKTRPNLMTQPAAAMLGLLLFLPFHNAQASTATAEKAYQKGDFAAAEREYAAAAQRNPKQPDLLFNAGTAAYKAGQFPQAAAAFQKSLDGKPSADPKRLAAQEDAYYDLGNTLYRNGQKTEPANPQQTIQAWEQAVKTYDAALQLHANDADAKFNRDLVQRKLEELKKQQQQQNQKQNQDQKQDQQNKSAQNSGQKNQQNKDQKSDQQNQSGQNSQAKNQENQNQKSGAGSKPDQQKDQQQANSGSKPDQQKQPDQNGQQPQPANGQPQGNAQAQAGANPDQNAAAQAADSQVEPGQMSKADAQALLDSVKNEEQRLPTAPVARNGNISQQSDQPIKDW
ncbi:MAG: VWA domain-containing protein [Verrucomicrobiota bacterium]|jgi:Ca-activated chloride channel family protein